MQLLHVAVVYMQIINKVMYVIIIFIYYYVINDTLIQCFIILFVCDIATVYGI